MSPSPPAPSLAAGFPPTHASLLERTRSPDADVRERALETLAAVYWRPVYAHVRLAHRVEPADAEDLVQGFFAEALRRELLARYEPGRARFRSYLRACVDAHVASARRSERRLKRTGTVAAHAVDVSELEGRLAAPGADPDRVFEEEWVRGVLAAALARLRARYDGPERRLRLALFERYDVDGADAASRPTYARLAAEHGIPVTTVTNWLAAARRDFRAAVLETLRETCASDAEFRAEARALLGVDPR